MLHTMVPFKKNFKNQKRNVKAIKTILHIYSQLKKYLQQKHLTMLTIKHKYRKREKITKQIFFNKKKTRVNILSYYYTLKKNSGKTRNKAFWTELQTLFRNMARLQFKNKVRIKEKSLKSLLYPKTQFYKIRTKVLSKYYYFFNEVYYN